jgi:hypothetical protein
VLSSGHSPVPSPFFGDSSTGVDDASLAQTPTERARGALALLVGCCAAAILWLHLRRPGNDCDFDLVWHGARAIWQGYDPYAVIGPGLVISWPWAPCYPLTAMIAALPVAVLPIAVARLVFVGGSAALLAWAITFDGYARIPLLFSAPFINAVQHGQWSPLLTASVLLPWLGWVTTIKPNIGLAIVASTSSPRLPRIAILTGLALGLISLAIQPQWPSEWLGTLSHSPHLSAPIARLGGPLILLALFRWRRPEARLLVALACVPQTPLFYEMLPILLVARNLREMLVMTLLSHVAILTSSVCLGDANAVAHFAALHGDAATLAWMGTVHGRAMNAFCYLPALVLVLLRPNHGPLPLWLWGRAIASGPPPSMPLTRGGGRVARALRGSSR